MDKVHDLIEDLGYLSDSWGLIHYDLHAGNCLFYEGEVRPIDFSLCGFGHYLHDFAIPFMSLGPEARRAFLEGYRNRLELQDGYQRAIEEFLCAMYLEVWACNLTDPTCNNEWADRAPEAIRNNHRKFLNRSSFLFG